MREGYTLLEVLAVSVLLAGFLVAFFEGSQTIGAASYSQQNRLEALMVLLRESSRWRVDDTTHNDSTGVFGNGVGYTLYSSPVTFTQSGKGWKRLASTVSWLEPDLNSQSTRALTSRRITFKEL